MHPRNAFARHGKQTKGIVVTQVRLGGKRELGQIGQRLQIVGVNALILAFLAKGSDVLVGVVNAPLQALQLQGGDFVAACRFNGLKFAWLGLSGGHDRVS